MSLLSTSLCLIVIACDIFAIRHGIRPRVIHGVDDDTDEYPYVVCLQHVPNYDTALIPQFENTPTRACTGSLITDRWVITAAHCIDQALVKITLVRYGNMSLPVNSTTFFSKVLKLILHPSYHPDRRNDIGLLLAEKIPLKYYGRLSAVDFNSLTGLRVRYAGFGRTWSEELNKINVVPEMEKWALKPLQIGDAAIVKCDEPYKTIGPLMCIVPPCANKKQQSAHGDSGGPLLVGNKIVGVLRGYSNEDHNVHLYTPVSPYLDWIIDVMTKEK